MKCQINRFTEFLRNKKYSERTIRLYLNELEKIDIVDFKSAKDLDVFINSTVNNAKNQGLTKSHIDSLRAGLHQLFLMSFGITIKEYRSQNNSKDFIELLLDDFFNYSTNFKSQTISTAMAEKSHIRTFLNYIGFDASYDFSQMKIEDIIDFINTCYTSLKESTKGRYITSIRNFFRFLDYKNINVSKEILDLPLVTPNWKGRMVPIVLSKEEQSKIRNHFDQQNGIGLRNYLIISLMMDYGLRCAEIPAITIDNIQWSTNDLIIRNTKNNNNRCIPLSKNTLTILERYILQFKNNNSNFLFTTINPRKIDLKMSTEEVRRIIRTTFRKENIKGYWKGTHALRRTAASNLFNNTNSFKIVSDILGHESIDSTTSYVRVDFELLRSITSPWPGYGGEVHD